MVKGKGDYVSSEIYGAHLKGGRSRLDYGAAQTREMVIERMYQRKLLEMSANRFKWSGLPDSVNVRFLEMTLTREALVLLWQDSMYEKLMVSRATMMGPLNFNDEPTRYRTIGYGLRSRTLIPGRTCVPIWDNYMRMPDWDIIRIYAHRLANFDRTIEINGRNARRNRIFVIGENSQLTAANVDKLIESGQQTIQLNMDAFNPEQVQALDLGIHPDSLEKLSIVKTRIWGEVMGLMGIRYGNQDKKERLVAAEVGANDEQTTTTRNIALTARQEAADMINRMYGLDVQVDYRIDVEDMAAAAIESMIGGGENGDIHG